MCRRIHDVNPFDGHNDNSFWSANSCPSSFGNGNRPPFGFSYQSVSSSTSPSGSDTEQNFALMRDSLDSGSQFLKTAGMPNDFLYHNENGKNNNAKGTPCSSSAGSNYHELYGNEFTRSFDSRRSGEAIWSSSSSSSDYMRNYCLQKFGRGNWSNSSGSSSYERYRFLHSPVSQEGDGSGWSSNSMVKSDYIHFNLQFGKFFFKYHTNLTQ